MIPHPRPLNPYFTALSNIKSIRISTTFPSIPIPISRFAINRYPFHGQVFALVDTENVHGVIDDGYPFDRRVNKLVHLEELGLWDRTVLPQAVPVELAAAVQGRKGGAADG